MTTYELCAQQAMARNSAVSNALMAQKSGVLDLLNAGDVFGAKALLDVLRPLWDALDYGYKGNELARAVRDEAKRLLEVDVLYLPRCRPNSRARRDTLAGIDRLEKLIEGC